MKTFNLFSFCSILLLFASCGEKEDRTVVVDETATQMEYQDPDEAIENWPRAWNSNDVNQIQAQTADDVVVVVNGRELPMDSLVVWIQSAGSAMKDLQMNSLKRGSSETVAYDTGTFSHTYSNDTTQYRGSYTFIWERANDGNEWKVKSMNISDEEPEE